MSSENAEFDGGLIEAFLRFVRGRGPRPETGGLPEDERAKHEELFNLLEAIVDSDAVETPPFEEDPVAIRLGLIGRQEERPEPQRGAPSDVPPLPVGIASALDDLVHRLNDEVQVVAAGVNGEVAGLRPVAECRSLGELVLICSTQSDEFSDLPGVAAQIFARRPTVSAVAVVSATTSQAVVFTHADCVSAIDPIAGWVEPRLPAPPEPLELALGRHLEKTLPRWDEIAKLDELLILAHPEDDVASAAIEALTDTLGRTAKIPAKKKALLELRDLSSSTFESVLNDVRTGRLMGETLIRRLRKISEADFS